jgi:UDP-N-acetylglucosamine/UDP-N-acetylgalactosamine diphosphorylase
VFFGYALEKRADVGVKVVRRTSPDEAVGVVCLQKYTEEKPEGEDLDTSSEDDSESDDTDKTRETSSSSYYGVLEYNEMPDTLRTAKEGDDLVYRAAHICVNLFSLDYLTKLANPKLELGFHSALKRIPCLKKDESGEWETHVPDQPNGIKLEQFIFDAFKYCDPEKVSLGDSFNPPQVAKGSCILE